jgi:hypothetical protein
MLDEVLGVESNKLLGRGVVRMLNDKDDEKMDEMMKMMRKLGSNVLPSCNGILIAKEMW